MRVIVASLVGCMAVFNAGGQSAAASGGRIRNEGSRICFIQRDGNRARNGRAPRHVYTDYERKGFFRIGLLPIGVMEGVTFELQHPESVTNGLAELNQWLGAKAAKRLELRRVNFLVSAPATNHLATGRARVGGRRQAGNVRRGQIRVRDKSNAGCTRRFADHRRTGRAACPGNHSALDQQFVRSYRHS